MPSFPLLAFLGDGTRKPAYPLQIWNIVIRKLMIFPKGSGMDWAGGSSQGKHRRNV
jgi:hypothetical protein